MMAWDALGLKSETAELIASVLELEFRYGHICVEERCADMPNLVSTIETAFQSAWRFREFTESRWLTVGASARSLVVAVLTGLMDLVEEIDEAHMEASSTWAALPGSLEA